MAPREGQVTVDWFGQLFKGVIGISTLGAGFTFSVIVWGARSTC